ncbi:hypothetical protein RJT34_31672 [Clitoria ternatea]|uniref:Bifunctional inhibitor/plant lipid transfer protein/seed storage helical domain-containing protein n=1 Tax=Clitoria ternatea TaxID=43366 RepID=A0AAN9I3T0_CLITE
MATGCNLRLVILVVIGLLTYNTEKVSGQCGGNVPDIVSKCSQFVEKSGAVVPPSAECCAVLRNIDVPCICKLVTREVEKLVSIPKAIFVARSCGLNVPPGMQCGSVKVPPKAMKP